MKDHQQKDFHTIDLFGLQIASMAMSDTQLYLHTRIEHREITQIVTINPIMLMQALQDATYMKMLQEAELIVPDGAGVVWASRLLKTPVQERVAGIDLMMKLLAKAEEKQWKVYFLGASPTVLQKAIAKLQERYPNLQICGSHDGYFGQNDDEAVVKEIIECRPDLLFVGRSANQQEPWIHRFKEQLAVPIMMGVGGSFDVISGTLKRAPKSWQKLHLEWLFRLIQEPWRFKRMLVLPKFIIKVLVLKIKRSAR